jgi:hypothetical protein
LSSATSETFNRTGKTSGMHAMNMDAETAQPVSASKVTKLHSTPMAVAGTATPLEMMAGAMATADTTAGATVSTAPPEHFVEQLAGMPLLR